MPRYAQEKKKKTSYSRLIVGIILIIIGAYLLYDYFQISSLLIPTSARPLPTATDTSTGTNFVQTFTGRQIARDSQGNIYMLGRDAGTNEHFIYIYKNGALSSTRKIEQDVPTGWTATYGTSPRCSTIAIDSNDVIYVVFDSPITEEGVGTRRFIIEYIKSIDYGNTWTQPYVVLNGRLDYSGSPLYYREMDSPTLLIDSAGGIHIFYQGSSIYKTTEVVYVTSTDQGTHWDYYEVIDHSQNLNTAYGTLNVEEISVAMDTNNKLYLWVGGTIGMSDKQGCLMSTGSDGRYWSTVKILPEDFGLPSGGRDMVISGNKIIFVGGSSNSLVWGESSDGGNSWTVHKETISSNDSPYPRLVTLNGQITTIYPYWEQKEGKYYLGLKSWNGTDVPTSILQFDTPFNSSSTVFLDVPQSSKTGNLNQVDLCVITSYDIFSTTGGNLYYVQYPYTGTYSQQQQKQKKPDWELYLGIILVIAGAILVATCREKKRY